LKAETVRGPVILSTAPLKASWSLCDSTISWALLITISSNVFLVAPALHSCPISLPLSAWHTQWENLLFSDISWTELENPISALFS
jgi:hypothetical protein